MRCFGVVLVTIYYLDGIGCVPFWGYCGHLVVMDLVLLLFYKAVCIVLPYWLAGAPHCFAINSSVLRWSPPQ